MISKELLSEVLNVHIAMPPILENLNQVGYLKSGVPDSAGGVLNYHRRINIYELANKCKEWALSEGYIIWLGKEGHINLSPTYSAILFKEAAHIELAEKAISHTMYHKSELDAVTEICDWILKNKRKNK